MLPRIDTQTLTYIQTSPFVPFPDSVIVRKVAGAEVSAMDYRVSGVMVAADAYNAFAEVTESTSPNGIRIVDIGCGSGRVASFLCQFFPSCDYLGFDVQPDLIEWASRELGGRLPNLKFQRVGEKTNYAGSDAFTLPVEDASADLTLASSLFTHLDEDASVGYLREMRRFLKPGGVGYVTFFRFDEDTEAFARAAAERNGHRLIERGKGWLWGAEGIYDTFFRKEDFAALASSAGLNVVKIRDGYWNRG